MSDIKSCLNCGSTLVEYLYVETHPSIHCKDCNILVTRLTEDQLSELRDQLNDLKDIKEIINNKD
jgi:hypothetical protein